jgi:hypothetical protein
LSIPADLQFRVAHRLRRRYQLAGLGRDIDDVYFDGIVGYSINSQLRRPN